MGRARRPYSMWAFLGRVAERSVRKFLDDAVPQVAGSIAYRVVFSVFPLAIVVAALSAIVLQTTGSQDEVVDAIVRNVPLSDDGKEDMRGVLEGATGTLSGLGLLALLPLIWAATGMMGAIRYGLNKAWDVSQTRPFLQGKAFDLLFVLLAFALFAVSLGLSVSTSIVERHAADLIEDIGLSAAVVTWLFGRLVPFVLASLAVLAAYRLLPAIMPPFSEIWPSALGVAFVLTLLQSLFGLYLSYVNDFNAVYGSLAAVIAFLYFTYLAAMVFLLGAEIAAAIPRVRRELEEGPEETADEDSSASFARQLWGAVKGLAVRDDAASTGDEEGEKKESGGREAA